jgi:integrase
MAKRFTSKTIENARPKADRYELSDGGGPLRLVVYPSSRRAFIVRYRRPSNRKTAKLTFEPGWPQLSLHDARVAAAEAMKQLGKGVDPAAAKQAVKAAAMEAQANTVAAVCAAYLKREGAKLRTSAQRESIFRRLIYPAIGDKPIDSIRRSDIFAMLDKIADRNGARMSDVTLSTLRRVLNWHALRDDNFFNPIVPGMNRQQAKDHRRERILSDDEIRAVWAATADGQPFSALVRFALLTSARRNEIAGMKWDEVDDGGVWTLPAARSKTKTEIIRPLSKAALAVLDGLPRIDGCPFVFTSNGLTPLASFSDPKAALDARSQVVGWRLHDLRRTARSLLSRCKDVSVDHAERVLGHSLGDIRGRYDKHDYVEEMRFAVEALAALVERIVNPPEGEIADMAAERSKRRR